MEHLRALIGRRIEPDIHPAIAAFARDLGHEARASAVLFYGSNLRTGSLDGVLDFYVLTPDDRGDRIWPRVGYRERTVENHELRAKIATMPLAMFAQAARGDTLDTTIWARFAQPCALAWYRGDAERRAVVDAIAAATVTAARLAAALGPSTGRSEQYWRALFGATYEAEFRVERAGRGNDIIDSNAEHFADLLPLALEAGGVACDQRGDRIAPCLPARERARIVRWWKRRRQLGKPLNLLRLAKASTTFEGAARYGAWKIERHTGMLVEVTPWRERHPLLAAPGVFLALRRHRRRAGG